MGHLGPGRWRDRRLSRGLRPSRAPSLLPAEAAPSRPALTRPGLGQDQGPREQQQEGLGPLDPHSPRAGRQTLIRAAGSSETGIALRLPLLDTGHPMGARAGPASWVSRQEDAARVVRGSETPRTFRAPDSIRGLRRREPAWHRGLGPDPLQRGELPGALSPGSGRSLSEEARQGDCSWAQPLSARFPRWLATFNTNRKPQFGAPRRKKLSAQNSSIVTTRGPCLHEDSKSSRVDWSE